MELGERAWRLVELEELKKLEELEELAWRPVEMEKLEELGAWRE